MIAISLVIDTWCAVQKRSDITYGEWIMFALIFALQMYMPYLLAFRGLRGDNRFSHLGLVSTVVGHFHRCITHEECPSRSY